MTMRCPTPWYRVGVNMSDHWKIRRIGIALTTYFHYLLAYSMRHRLDGVFDCTLLASLWGSNFHAEPPVRTRLTKRGRIESHPITFDDALEDMVSVGLLDVVGEGMYAIHNYADWQPTSESNDAKMSSSDVGTDALEGRPRSKGAERVARFRARKRAMREEAPVTSGVTGNDTSNVTDRYKNTDIDIERACNADPACSVTPVTLPDAPAPEGDKDLDFGSLIEEAELEGHIPPATDRSSGIMRAAPRTPPDEPSPPEPPQGSDPEAVAASWPEYAPAIGEVEEVVGEPVDLPLSRTPQPVGTVRQDLVVDGRHVTVYAAAPAPAPTVWGTPPPDDLPISMEFADGCVMAGLPRPTSLHVAAMLDWHRANGKTSADWYASLRTWMRREGSFGSRWGGPMKARAQVFEVAPPPEPLTPEELANAPTKSFSEMTKREQWEHYRKMSEEQLYGKSA